MNAGIVERRYRDADAEGTFRPIFLRSLALTSTLSLRLAACASPAQVSSAALFVEIRHEYFGLRVRNRPTWGGPSTAAPVHHSTLSGITDCSCVCLDYQVDRLAPRPVAAA